MEYIILLLETLFRYIGEFSSGILFTIILTVLIYMVKESKQNNKFIDKRFNDQEKSIEELRLEYQEGITEIRKELSYITDEILVELEEGQKDNKRLTLRAIITNNALPIEYRLRSYDDYKNLKGNSWVSDYVNRYLLNQDERGE